MSEFAVTSGTASQVLETLRERALVRLLSTPSFDWRDYLTDEEIVQYDAAVEAQGKQHESEVALTGETLANVGKALVEIYRMEEQQIRDTSTNFLERADMPQPDGEDA